MGSIALYMASGESLYFGAALLVAVVAVSPFLKLKWLLALRNIAFYLALAAMVVAAPPFSWFIDTAFFAFAGLWFITSNKPSWPPRLRMASALILCAFAVWLASTELSHRGLPALTGVPGDHLVVIGDSLSAGINSSVPPWPVYLQRASGVPIKNLSLPGATTAEAKIMAAKIKPEDRVVLIEIGGNDLLSDVPCKVFADNLGSVLNSLIDPDRTLVMFELPILPNKIACGQYQRHLAAAYHVTLIPKHYLIDIIGGPDATLDGLHLSDSGARHFAELVQKVMQPALKRPSAIP
jgi:acyl-CoA thioesterase I